MRRRLAVAAPPGSVRLQADLPRAHDLPRGIELTLQ
jgi:hypothetical protein